MVRTTYYIEDLVNGFVLQDDGTWNWFTDVNEETFETYQSALDHIETLDDGVYKIFNRVSKV